QGWGEDPRPESWVRMKHSVFAILIAAYFLQVVTPLRLHPDTVVLMTVAESVQRGTGYLFHGQPTVFPPGYPTLIALLAKLHLAYVGVFVALNVVFMVLGLLAVRYLLSDFFPSRRAVFGICVVSLLSMVFIRFSALLLTDMIFFGVSMCSLAALKSASRHLSWKNIFAGT